MNSLKPETRQFIILGIISISIIAMFINFENGKDITLVGLGGLIAFIKGDE